MICLRTITVSIRGCNTPEKWDQVKECLLEHQQVRRNIPLLYVDFPDRVQAHLALANLNQLQGIKAEVIQDQYRNG